MKENPGGIWALIKNKRFAPGKGVTELPPERGIKRFGFLLWNHVWKLVTLNLLFLAFSIPVVTMPAAVCGMNRALIMLVREGNCFLWDEFWKEFRANLFKSFPFGAMFAFLLFDSYYALSVDASGGGVIGVLMTGVGYCLLILAALFFNYVFILLPALNLKKRYIAKNAFILMMTEWKTNMVIIGITLVSALFLVALFPFTVIPALLIWFAMAQLAVCVAVNDLMQRRIIGPFEQNQTQDIHSSSNAHTQKTSASTEVGERSERCQRV